MENPRASQSPNKRRKVRLLVLHGFPGTIGAGAGVDPIAALCRGLATRRIDVEVVAPRAPTACESGDGVAWIAGDQAAAGRLVGFGLRGWSGLVDVTQLSEEPLEDPFTPSDFHGDNGDDVWHGCEGFESSLEALEREWTAGDDFDGILGFSQGALMASLFLAYLRERRLRAPAFAVLCGGFRRPWPAEATPYWPPRPALDVPSLHVIGTRDAVVAPFRSDELCAEFSDFDTYRHALIGEPRCYGGHVLPWDSPFHDRLARHILRAMNRSGGSRNGS